MIPTHNKLQTPRTSTEKWNSLVIRASGKFNLKYFWFKSLNSTHSLGFNTASPRVVKGVWVAFCISFSHPFYFCHVVSGNTSKMEHVHEWILLFFSFFFVVSRIWAGQKETLIIFFPFVVHNFDSYFSLEYGKIHSLQSIKQWQVVIMKWELSGCQKR